MSIAEPSIKPYLDDLVKKTLLYLGQESKEFRYVVSIVNNWLSSIYLLKIDFTFGGQREVVDVNDDDESKKNLDYKCLHLFVKVSGNNKVLDDFINWEILFRNEMLFYCEFAKYDVDAKRKENRYARCYYTDMSLPHKVLVLEDVSVHGYGACKKQFNIDRCYANAALREIARFHAFGYSMKARRSAVFFALVNEICEPRIIFDKEKRYDHMWSKHFDVVINTSSTRAVRYLKKVCLQEELSYWEGVETFLANPYENVLKQAMAPVEPITTLCHGDFTIMNTLFKEEKQPKLKSNESEEQKGNLKALLIDFAMIRYVTPTWDLSTFFCLSCVDAILRGELPDLLATYHNELTRSLIEDYDESQLALQLPYEIFYHDYQRNGLYGFLIASYFLDVTMGKLKLDPVSSFNLDNIVNVYKLGKDDEVPALLANILIKLKDFGCLDYLS